MVVSEKLNKLIESKKLDYIIKKYMQDNINKELSQLIVNYIKNNKQQDGYEDSSGQHNNRDEILFYLATTDNPCIKLNIYDLDAMLESLVDIHKTLYDLTCDLTECISLLTLTIIIEDEISLDTVKDFKVYLAGYKNTYKTIIDIEYIFHHIRDEEKLRWDVNLETIKY